MKISGQLLFPTPIYTAKLDDAEQLNTELLSLVYAERDRDSDGIQRSNYRELKGWHSQINLHKDPAFSGLLAKLHEVLEYVSADSGYDPNYRLVITSMWAITNDPGSFNRSHIHPKCQWSGVYYVQTPEDSGSIEFTDPRSVNIMTQPRYIPKRRRPKSRWTKITFKPESGKAVLFPSWLYHSVGPNMSSDTDHSNARVIISFNVTQRRR